MSKGWLLELTQGDETLRQSKFYRFNNAFLPGHIERWVANRKLIEIDENIVIREEYPPDYFAYPTGASLRNMCTAFQRAFADKTPQPLQKMSSNDLTDVRVHGFIGKDGKPYGLKSSRYIAGRPRPGSRTCGVELDVSSGHVSL